MLIYNQAVLNIGDPPSAEAYCRALAMEVERLARQDERERSMKLICGECDMDTPIDKDGYHTRKDARGKTISFDCDAGNIRKGSR